MFPVWERLVLMTQLEVCPRHGLPAPHLSPVLISLRVQKSLNLLALTRLPFGSSIQQIYIWKIPGTYNWMFRFPVLKVDVTSKNMSFVFRPTVVPAGGESRQILLYNVPGPLW